MLRKKLPNLNNHTKTMEISWLFFFFHIQVCKQHTTRKYLKANLSENLLASVNMMAGNIKQHEQCPQSISKNLQIFLLARPSPLTRDVTQQQI